MTEKQSYHILNGDVLLHQLKELGDPKIVFRECLIDGPIRGNSLEEILENRYDFFKNEYNVQANDYKDKSINEILKLFTIDYDSQINLWFESDLFCQLHFWCIINFINPQHEVFLVSPIVDSWNGFGHLSHIELMQSLENKTKITQVDKNAISELWKGFQSSDWEKMKLNARKLSHLIPSIEEVINAHIERFPSENSLGRPEQSLQEIINSQENTSFESIFKRFSEKEGIYGFGDVQVRKILSSIGWK